MSSTNSLCCTYSRHTSGDGALATYDATLILDTSVFFIVLRKYQMSSHTRFCPTPLSTLEQSTLGGSAFTSLLTYPTASVDAPRSASVNAKLTTFRFSRSMVRIPMFSHSTCDGAAGCLALTRHIFFPLVKRYLCGWNHLLARRARQRSADISSSNTTNTSRILASSACIASAIINSRSSFLSESFFIFLFSDFISGKPWRSTIISFNSSMFSSSFTSRLRFVSTSVKSSTTTTSCTAPKRGVQYSYTSSSTTSRGRPCRRTE
mmetsp:Transcript_16888/g.57691  ORF Transcript_16888/g.57691 Transcript_16888/m.57691 type:complete len:263 (-) Transcript_16888:490-1278(-)